jgi:hypothetical protein
MTTFSAAFVEAHSRRSEWRKRAPILNSKCNPATPFSLDLQQPMTLFGEAWSHRVSSGQPAGPKQRIVCRRAASVITHSSTAAFHVTNGDTRMTLRDITLGSTVVFPGSYSVTMSASDNYTFTASDPRFFESFFKNISDGITDGFQHLLSAREGSVFMLPLGFQMRFSPVSGQVVMEGSGLMIALNASEPSSYDGWRERAIAAFHSRTPSPAIRNLVSLQTFQVRFVSLATACLYCPAPLIKMPFLRRMR